MEEICIIFSSSGSSRIFQGVSRVFSKQILEEITEEINGKSFQGIPGENSQDTKNKEGKKISKFKS